MSQLKVNALVSYSGNTVTLGTSGDTINVASGVTFNTASATVSYPAGSITNAAINASAAIATTKLGAGAVLQVLSTTKTDTASSSSSTFTDITGLSVNITPSSASNKILVLAYINVAYDYLLAKVGVRIMRGSTALAIGDTAGSRIRTSGFLYADSENYSTFTLSVNFLDSPSSTSALTYKCQFSNLDNAGTVYVNRAESDTDSTITGRSASGITVMEIAG
jgi:hypothetical protein